VPHVHQEKGANAEKGREKENVGREIKTSLKKTGGEDIFVREGECRKLRRRAAHPLSPP